MYWRVRRFVFAGPSPAAHALSMAINVACLTFVALASLHLDVGTQGSIGLFVDGGK
jgi:hypothetical protein